MSGLNLNLQPDSTLKVLCLGAHSDDIEIGCGGTILKLIKTYPNLVVNWVVFGANQAKRAAEALASAQAFLDGIKEKQIVIKEFRDGFFPYNGAEIKEHFEQLKELSPDLIFTHYRHDLHQDHRVLCDLTWNTFRDHLILEYEIPKYDGDLGVPNFFVHLDGSTCQKKIDLIITHFKTQDNKHWFTDETFRSLLRLRGIESKASSGYAEGFYCRKMIFQ